MGFGLIKYAKMVSKSQILDSLKPRMTIFTNIMVVEENPRNGSFIALSNLHIVNVAEVKDHPWSFDVTGTTNFIKPNMQFLLHFGTFKKQ